MPAVKIQIYEALVVIKLVAQSLQTPEICASKHTIDKSVNNQLNNCKEKTKMKEWLILIKIFKLVVA